MTTDMHPTDAPDARATRKPVIGLMGEFSAGKSTLTNLLVGARSLPVQVTATQLPPVWLSHGTDAPVRIDLEGVEHPVNLEDAGHIDLDATQHIRVHKDADILELCDLIDMPGISDPNMAADVWQRMIHHADIVLWCSHATQAWRQSEAAVWLTMPHELYSKSLLLLTRMDRILSDRDKQRVIRRVEKETNGLFRSVLPVSLLQALEAGDDVEKWEASGASGLSDALVDLVDEFTSKSTGRQVSRVRSRALVGVEASLGEDVTPAPRRMVMPTRVRPRPLSSRPLSAPTSRF